MSSAALRKRIEEGLAESAYVKLLLIRHGLAGILKIGEVLARALRKGKRVYLFGNGGSAADAQHIAAELEGRFRKNRRALPALALTTNTSSLTAIGNDFSYDDVFARLVEAHVGKGDVVIGISTSGNSPNVLRGVQVARKRGAVTVGLTNEKGGKLKKAVHHCLCAPSLDTQRVQECHITIGHMLCEVVEATLFP